MLRVLFLLVFLDNYSDKPEKIFRLLLDFPSLFKVGKIPIFPGHLRALLFTSLSFLSVIEMNEQ